MLHRLAYYFVLVLLPLVSFSEVSAQAFTEKEVKSAYIYNFARFIEWPSIEESLNGETFKIGFYGKDNFSEVLQVVLKERKIGDLPIEVITFDKRSEIDCHILIVSQCPAYELDSLFRELAKSSILTVGDNIASFCETGGIINFTPRGSSKQFEINNDAARRNKLIISSKLLALAKIVTDEEDVF